MSMLSGQSLGPSKNGGSRPGWTTVLFVVLMMAVLFGAGFGISWLLRGGTNSSATPTVSGAPGASPCTTVTVVPAATLPKPGKVTANVYNGTDKSGLARRTATELTARGFIVAKVANDPLGKSVTGVAQLRYGAKGLANAQLLKFYFAGAALVKDARADATVDVVLGAQFTKVESSASVQKAITTPVAVTTGNCKPSTSSGSPKPSGS